MKKIQLFFHRVCFVLPFVVAMFFAGSISAKNKPLQSILDKLITLEVRNENLKNVITEIKRKSSVSFIYSSSVIQTNRKVSINVADKRLKDVLDEICKPLQVGYKVVNEQILLYKIENAKANDNDGNTIRKANPITGIVTNATTGKPVSGATIAVRGKDKLVTTDNDGSFTIDADEGDVLIVTGVGYTKYLVNISSALNYTVKLQPTDATLGTVTVIGSRGKPRSDLNKPVPVDVITEKEMRSTGHNDITQMIGMIIPSFNSARQTISNGTDHIDPATLRGLGPDQVLMLVNGKRWHSSALVNVNSTVGRGSVGTDLNSIPASAIQRIEVLRDGAAAQYGSDAIAGIINVVLKNKVKELDVAAQLGKTGEGDGEVFQVGANYGLPISKSGGFINFTADYRKRNATNRVGRYNNNAYTTLLPQTRYQGLPNYVQLTAAQLENQRLDDSISLSRGFDKNNVMNVGNSEAENIGLFTNVEIPISTKSKFYANAGFNSRNGKASGFFRFPNNSRTNNLTLYPNGYLPFIYTKIIDKSITAGYSTTLPKDWDLDISTIYGGNSVQFNVKNSLNASYGNSSPKEFYCGKLFFNQLTNNLTLTKDFGNTLNLQSFNVAFGTEYRIDYYKIEKGEEASYKDANPVGTLPANVKASGVQVFGGFTPTNETDVNRTNIGLFADVESDITKKLLIGAALRYENYSDFGGNVSGKLVTRYKITDNISFRAGINRGFRAPSLHQKYFSSLSTQFITVAGVNQQKEVLTVNNNSDIVKAFGIPQLKPELSWNYSAGITAGKGSFQITVDGYFISIKDRIVISGRFSNTNPQVANLLSGFPGVSDVQFFSNAIDTRTKGLDIVATKKVNVSKKTNITFSLAANFNETDIVGDSAGVKTSAQLNGFGETLFNREERGRIEVNQPKSKITFNSNLKLAAYASVNLRFTRYGEISTIAPQDPLQDQTFSSKILTDILATWNINKRISWNIGANNLFNVYPDKVKDPRLTNDGTVVYSRFATQFGFNGIYFFSGLNVKL